MLNINLNENDGANSLLNGVFDENNNDENLQVNNLPNGHGSGDILAQRDLLKRELLGKILNTAVRKNCLEQKIKIIKNGNI